MPLLLLVGLDARAAERRYAVVVGANRGDADDAPLRFAEEDARRVAEVLGRQGGVSPENLIRLEGRDANAFRGVLASLARRIEDEQAEDDRALLFVYYSGHADAGSLHLQGTRLPLPELRQLVSDVPAEARVLILDACQAGSLTRRKGAVPAVPFQIVVQEQQDAEGLAILTSAAPGEDAQESDRLSGGVFTHHFVAGLQGAADTSGDLQVTLTEAWRYSADRTLASTSAAPALQHPSFAYDLAGRDDLVLTRLDDASRGGWLLLQEAGEYLLFDRRSQGLVSEFDVQAGGRLLVAEGRYLLRRRTPARLWEGEISIGAGQSIKVEAGLLRPVPYGQATRRGGPDQGRTALSLVVGGGLLGPLQEGLSAAPLASFGLRLDTAPLTLFGKARANRSTGENEDLSLTQDSLGGELGMLKLLDVGPVSVGPGVVLGVDRVWQRFETTGEAPERAAFVGRAGPVLRAEIALHPRLSLGLQGGVDTVLLPVEDEETGTSTLGTAVVPSAGLDLGMWLF